MKLTIMINLLYWFVKVGMFLNAGETLKRGFENVCTLKGGINEWKCAICHLFTHVLHFL